MENKTIVKVIGIIAGSFALLIIILVILVKAVSGPPIEVNLGNYVKAKSSGIDGTGNVDLSLDYNSLREDYEELSNSLQGEVNVNTSYSDGQFSNGDKLTCSISLDNPHIPGGYILKYDKCEFTVMGLKSKEQAKKEAEEAARRERVKYNTGLTFEQLARDPKKHAGKYVKFTGKIIQVISDGLGGYQYRFTINDDYNKVVLLTLDSNLVSKKLLEDDYVTIKGVFEGEASYTTVMGAEKTLPQITIEKYSLK